jgi:DNA-binding NtrC family response regulator
MVAEKQIPIILLIAEKKIRNYIIDLHKRNNYKPLVVTNPERLVQDIKRLSSAIIFIDYKAVSIYGTRIYSRINVSCPDCNTILLCDQNHRDLIKEAMDLGVYACILSPYKEWEVVTMIRNILAKKKSLIKILYKSKRL